jgi:hypothetical protein
MRTRRTVLWVVLTAAVAAWGEEPGAMAVVVHPSNSATSMSARSVVDVYTTRRQYWANHEPITLVLNTAAETRKAFYSAVLKLSPEELDRLLAQRRYQGALQVTLVKVGSDAEALKLVGETPNANSYVRSGAEQGAPVKTVLTVHP